jgi:hypothetical protein
MSEISFIEEPDEPVAAPGWKIIDGFMFIRDEHVIPVDAVVGVEFGHPKKSRVTIHTSGHRVNHCFGSEADANAFVQRYVAVRRQSQKAERHRRSNL